MQQRRNWWMTLALFAVAFTCAVVETKEHPLEETAQTETTQTETAPQTTEETRKYFDVPLSSQIQDCIFEECEKHNISPALVVALIERESIYDANTIGDNGQSFGLMQIQPKWHTKRMEELNCTDLLDPCQNIKVGVDILAELEQQNPYIYWVLMAYNGGAKAANERLASGDISDYANYIVERANELNERDILR